MFSSSYKVCHGDTALGTTSSITDVSFYQDAANTEDNFIYRFLAGTDYYEFDTVDISYGSLYNVQCYSCTIPVY